MRGCGIAGYRRRRRVTTTTVPDLLNRDFTASAPNVKYVGDITYLPLAIGGNLYLATVIDCFSRRVAGWAIAEHMRPELVEDALTAAAALRGSLAGSMLHSDHGSQYTSKDFATLCGELDGHPVDGRCGVQCRQRARRIVQRDPQTRSPPRPRLLGRRYDQPR